jgi:hypothetical protein
VTTTPPPGHGPLTPEIREANTRIAMNPGAAQGITPAAGPVSVAPTQQAEPPLAALGYDFLTVNSNSITLPASPGTGAAFIANWTKLNGDAGSSLKIGDGSDDPSGIYMLQEGFYSVALTLYIGPELIGSPVASTIKCESNVPVFFNTPECRWHGTESRGGYSTFVFSGAFIGYVPPGASFFSAGVYVDVYWHDIGVDSSCEVSLDIARIR